MSGERAKVEVWARGQHESTVSGQTGPWFHAALGVAVEGQLHGRCFPFTSDDVSTTATRIAVLGYVKEEHTIFMLFDIAGTFEEPFVAILPDYLEMDSTTGAPIIPQTTTATPLTESDFFGDGVPTIFWQEFQSAVVLSCPWREDLAAELWVTEGPWEGALVELSPTAIHVTVDRE